MRIQNMKTLVGTMLALLLSAVTVHPAIAQTTTETETRETQTQTTTAQTIRGTVRSISDNSVTIEMADGRTQVITVSSADIQRLNLQTGMQIEATIDSASVATNMSVVTDTTATGTSTTDTTTGVSTTGTSTGVSTTGTSTTDTTTGVSTTDTSTTDTTTGVGTTSRTETTTQTTETETQPAAQSRPVRALW